MAPIHSSICTRKKDMELIKVSRTCIIVILILRLCSLKMKGVRANTGPLCKNNEIYFSKYKPMLIPILLTKQLTSPK